MPYININEYDNTITGPKTTTGNITAVPIIATDGPSDKWITVYSYDDFIQTFGPKPVSNSVFGSSWEYAANLLMRKMPVCVRRITHELDEKGNNIGGSELPGVATASTILKVADILGNLSLNTQNLVTTYFTTESGDIKDPHDHSKLSLSKIGNVEKNPYYYNDPILKELDKEPTDDYVFNSIYELETYSLNNIKTEGATALTDNTFADVKDDGSRYPWISTNAEWFHTAKYENEHYKKINNSTYVKNLNEVLDEQPDGVKGDFYLLKEDSEITRVDYIEGGYTNPNMYYGSTIGDTTSLDYPAQLISQKVLGSIAGNNIVNAATKDSFIEIAKNANNANDKKVWTYTNVRFFRNITAFNEYVSNYSYVEDNRTIYPVKENDVILLYVTGADNKSLGDTIKLYKVKHDATIEDDENTVTMYTNLTSLKKTKNVDSGFVIYNDENTTNTFNKDGFCFYKKNSENNYVVDDSKTEDVETYKTYFTLVKNNKWTKEYDTDTTLLNTIPKMDGAIATAKNKESIVYVYSGSNKIWNEINLSKDVLDAPIIVDQEDYENTGIKKLSKTILVPWISTGESWNTKRYKRKLLWAVATGEDKNDYLTELHWKVSTNPINTNSHTVITDAKTYINDVTITGNADVDKTSIGIKVNGYNDITIKKDYEEDRLVSGKIKITNSSYSPIKIYSFRVINTPDYNDSTLLYNAGLERITSAAERITNDPYLVVNKITSTGDKETISLSDLRPKRDLTLSEPKWYIELDPGYSIIYNRNLTNVQLNMKFAVYDDSDIEFKLYNSSVGEYNTVLSTLDNVEVEKTAIPHTLRDNTDISDIDSIDIVDGKGNFNLFKISYIYPGTNGGNIKTCVKTIKNQGIYIYVYRNSQYLERLELCSFRTQLTNGKVKILDIDINKNDIWRMILAKFQIYIGINDKSEFPKPLVGNYVRVELNHNIYDYNSFDYVTALLAQTGNNFATCTNGGDPDEEHVKHEIPYCYEPLKDKYRYDIKFISNGGFIDDFITSNNLNAVNIATYGTRPIEDAMLDVATTRKDCVAYLDIPFDASVEDVPFYFEHISSSYAAAYDPWCYISLSTGGAKWMPPSFIELYTHAKSIANGNKMYLPPAGVKRALVPEIIRTNHDLPSNYITDWQNSDSPQFINPIIWINGFDYSIYGQKTLYNVVDQSKSYQSALQNLNVRLVANEIKKLIFKTCVELTFELNNLMTWNEFKAKVEPTILRMQSEGVLTNYEIIMGTETMTSADLNSGHIVGTVRIAVVSAAVDWDINFEIQPNDITFYENDYNSTYGE